MLARQRLITCRTSKCQLFPLGPRSLPVLGGCNDEAAVFRFGILTLSRFQSNSSRLRIARHPASKAVSENTNESAAAIAELRALGPSGLQTLLQANSEEISQHVANPTLKPTSEWLRITAALDSVSQQKDSYLSGLYWYTDLNEARKAATASGKPIPSLRLLGKLTDELSCANSRFFRTVLYSNASVSASLRDRFVLHWESVRPVPLITIDFGDGRKLQRTITGNSIHYILDSDGRTIDALPGLYGPSAFLNGLAAIETVLKKLRDGRPEERLRLLNTYYRDRLNKISISWLADTKQIGGKEPAGVAIERDQNGEALRIMPLAVSKAITELPCFARCFPERKRWAESPTKARGRRLPRFIWTPLNSTNAALA